MKKTTWVVSSILLGTALLAGCGQANQTTSSTNTSATTSSQGHGTGIRAKAFATTLVKRSMTLAEKGKALDIPFAVQQNIDVVLHAWGKSNSQNAAGAGIYETYGSHSAAFGMNKGEQIFDVRSYSSKLKTITPLDVVSVLGKSRDTRHTSDSIIYMYPAGADYQLLFVFPKTRTGNIGKAVDHVSVFWPQGTVNSMAATQPAPSVVIDNVPGSTGSLFTFTIQNPPKGYRLVELEWILRHGTPVVNTYQQAIANGASGRTNPGFSISPDGKTYGFIYPSSMRSQTGIVRVMYQETSGAAMIGNSSSVKLK